MGVSCGWTALPQHPAHPPAAPEFVAAPHLKWYGSFARTPTGSQLEGFRVLGGALADGEQLQPIEAGAALRAIHDRVG